MTADLIHHSIEFTYLVLTRSNCYHVGSVKHINILKYVNDFGNLRQSMRFFCPEDNSVINNYK